MNIKILLVIPYFFLLLSCGNESINKIEEKIVNTQEYEDSNIDKMINKSPVVNKSIDLIKKEAVDNKNNIKLQQVPNVNISHIDDLHNKETEKIIQERRAKILDNK